MKNLLTYICGRGGGRQKFKQPQDLIICGHKIYPECQKQNNERKKQQWAVEKPKLDNARKLRGICFLDPDDKEFNETNNCALKKLELLVGTAMPCKLKTHQHKEICGGSDSRKEKHACIVEAHRSTRNRSGRTLPKDHEDRIAGNGFDSLSHFNLEHKFFSHAPSENPGCTSSGGQRVGEAREIASSADDRGKEQKRSHRRSTKNSMSTVHFAALMDLCHLKDAELEPTFQNYQGQVVLRGDIVKDDSGSYAVFTEQGSSASQMTAAKVMAVIARLSDCARQAADAVSASHPSQNGRRSKNIETCKDRMPIFMDSSTTTQVAQILAKHRRSSVSS